MKHRLYDIYLVAIELLLRVPGFRFRHAVLRRVIGADLGQGCAVERGVIVRARGGLTIGAGTNINHGTVLDNRGGLRIGERVNISPGVRIYTAEHDPASPAFAGRLREVVIEDRVWLASHALILPGVRVGEGAIVAAGSVVPRDVQPWAIVAGSPARVIGQRPQTAQQELPRFARWLH
jgi:maltose O-acetyltransferase